jgi:hypothetical protein
MVCSIFGSSRFAVGMVKREVHGSNVVGGRGGVSLNQEVMV